METMRSRDTELFLSVLLMVLGMIQALALELLWSRVRESATCGHGAGTPRSDVLRSPPPPQCVVQRERLWRERVSTVKGQGAMVLDQGVRGTG